MAFQSEGEDMNASLFVLLLASVCLIIPCLLFRWAARIPPEPPTAAEMEEDNKNIQKVKVQLKIQQQLAKKRQFFNRT